MKKMYSRIVVPLALALMAGSAFAAPKPQDLTTALISDGEWVAVGVHDFDTFWNKPDDSLLKNWIEIAGSGGRLPVSAKMSASDLRVSLEGEDVTGVALAIQLTDDVTFEEILTAGPADEPDFEVAEVEGAVISPLAVIRPMPDNERSAGDIYLAQLDREDLKFLIAASGSPENLAVMAAAPEGNAVVPEHVDSNMWLMLSKTMDTEKRGELDFLGEFGLDDTRTSVKIYSWVNVSGKVESAGGKAVDIAKVFENGTKPVKPNIFGKSPLYALANFSACFLNPELTVEDLVPNEENLAKAQERLAQLNELTGLEWSDVLSALRGNITFGISGSAKSLFVPGGLPGAYINISGLPAEASERLINAAKTLISGIISTEEYDNGDLKGISTSMPLTALLAAGSTGLTGAVMVPADIAITPRVDLSIAPAVNSAHNIALAFNTKELRPVLRDIYARWGNEIVGLLGGDDDVKEGLEVILASLSLIDGISIVNEKEITVTEITPNADIMALVLLANKMM